MSLMTHAFSWVGARCVDPAHQPHNRTHHKHIRDTCHIINNNNIIIIISSEEGEVDEQEEEEEDESLSHHQCAGSSAYTRAYRCTP